MPDLFHGKRLKRIYIEAQTGTYLRMATAQEAGQNVGARLKFSTTSHAAAAKDVTWMMIVVCIGRVSPRELCQPWLWNFVCKALERSEAHEPIPHRAGSHFFALDTKDECVVILNSSSRVLPSYLQCVTCVSSITASAFLDPVINLCERGDDTHKSAIESGRPPPYDGIH